jgi:hypothetical protein
LFQHFFPSLARFLQQFLPPFRFAATGDKFTAEVLSFSRVNNLHPGPSHTVDPAVAISVGAFFGAHDAPQAAVKAEIPLLQTVAAARFPGNFKFFER